MNQLEYRRSIRLAQDFLTRCFSPGEFIALLLRCEKPVAVTQRVVLLERAVAPRYLGWLAHQNEAGANIYAAANPLRSGTRKRTKESIASVRHLYLDIDSDGDAKLAALLNSNRVPKPTPLISTSPSKYQVLWRVEGFDFENQERTLKLLALAFGGDPACTDCNRVLRVPGFFNRKYNPAHPVAIQYPDANISHVNDFGLDISAPNPITPSLIPRRENIRASSAIRNSIGLGFCMNLPAEKMPKDSRENSLHDIPTSHPPLSMWRRHARGLWKAYDLMTW